MPTDAQFQDTHPNKPMHTHKTDYPPTCISFKVYRGADRCYNYSVKWLIGIDDTQTLCVTRENGKDPQCKRTCTPFERRHTNSSGK